MRSNISLLAVTCLDNLALHQADIVMTNLHAHNQSYLQPRQHVLVNGHMSQLCLTLTVFKEMNRRVCVTCEERTVLGEDVAVKRGHYVFGIVATEGCGSICLC